MPSGNEPPPHLLVRRATAADIAYVMATERLPGYDVLVAQWSADEHATMLGRADAAYLIVEAPPGTPAGFAILEGLTDHHLGVKLKRIALSEPGRGLGQSFLAEISRFVFTQTGAERLWLDVFVANERARRAYRRAGYREDGLLRQAYVLPCGARVDRVIMSMLRSEWEPH